MKQMSQVRDSVSTLARARRPTEPVAAISDADLDKVFGGGGKAGGVVGSRERND